MRAAWFGRDSIVTISATELECVQQFAVPSSKNASSFPKTLAVVRLPITGAFVLDADISSSGPGVVLLLSSPPPLTLAVLDLEARMCRCAVGVPFKAAKVRISDDCKWVLTCSTDSSPSSSSSSSPADRQKEMATSLVSDVCLLSASTGRLVAQIAVDGAGEEFAMSRTSTGRRVLVVVTMRVVACYELYNDDTATETALKDGDDHGTATGLLRLLWGRTWDASLCAVDLVREQATFYDGLLPLSPLFHRRGRGTKTTPFSSRTGAIAKRFSFRTVAAESGFLSE